MKYINSYLGFINEELVTKLDPKTHNVFSSIFNSDKLRLKEFIQKSIGLENLSFIAGGAIGLAFQWEDKVIKFTTDISEKEGVERMIEISPEGSKIPGFVKYYWIREVRLPEGSWRKSGKNITADLEDKVVNQRKISKTGQKATLLSPEEVENRKSDKKMKTAFIICLEKIETLNKVDSEIALKYPVILTSKGGEINSILDGQHRVAKALESGEMIKVRILDLDTAPDQFRKILD